MLLGFFEGWRRSVSPEEHLELLRGSDYAVLALASADLPSAGALEAVSMSDTARVHRIRIPAAMGMPKDHVSAEGPESSAERVVYLHRSTHIRLNCRAPLPKVALHGFSMALNG